MENRGSPRLLHQSTPEVTPPPDLVPWSLRPVSTQPVLGSFTPEKRPEPLTISDDRSAGSNLEVRNLVALKDRTVHEAQSEGDTFYQSASISDLDFGDEIDDRTRYIRRAFLHKQAMRLGQAQQRPQRTFHEEMMATGAKFTQLDGVSMDANDDVLSEMGNSAGEDDLSREVKTDNSWLHGAPTTHTTHLPVGEQVHKRGIKILQKQITTLQDELRQLENHERQAHPTPYQVLYQIGSERYFDHPEWTHKKRGIVSRAPVQNIDLFLERNKSVLFIVYRHFGKTSKIREDRMLQRPLPRTESIHFVNKRLRSGMESILLNNWRYDYFLPESYRTGQVQAPYLFIYHGRSNWQDVVAKFPQDVGEYLDVLTRYVGQNFGHEYAAADALFAERRFSINYVKYLFQPGDILVSREGGQFRGLLAKSWPTYNESVERGTESELTDSDDENDEESYLVPSRPPLKPFSRTHMEKLAPNDYSGPSRVIRPRKSQRPFSQAENTNRRRNPIQRKSGAENLS